MKTYIENIQARCIVAKLSQSFKVMMNVDADSSSYPCFTDFCGAKRSLQIQNGLYLVGRALCATSNNFRTAKEETK